jgi:hypothetical protein
MSRTIKQIYSEAIGYRDEMLQLTEYNNDSKMSVMNMITWVTSACIWTFENLLEVFKIDVVSDLQNRINGTPAYYANMLLKYQTGDDLVIDEDGVKFNYASVDTTKRIITKVSYSELEEAGFNDKKLLLKIASGEAGSYTAIDAEELIAIDKYIRKIAFAGTHIQVVSLPGDIIVPKLTVYYDGLVSASEVYTNIENALNEYIKNVDFSDWVYYQHIIDAIQSAEHVVDVDVETSDDMGIYLYQYDIEGNLQEKEKIGRRFKPNSGYVKQSNIASIPQWKETIVLEVES